MEKSKEESEKKKKRYVDEKLEELRKEVRDEFIKDEREFEKAISRILGTALALAAAFLWRDAILSTITRFFPQDQTWEWQLTAAILFTLISAIIILFSSRWSHQTEK